MIIGTVFTGHVKTQNKQWIETKMFCFGIPLYITNTMLVTDVTGRGRRGIEIKTNRMSILAAIIRPIVTIGWLISMGALIGNHDTMTWLWGPAILTTALFVYSWFFFGKTTKYEKFVRKQCGDVFGLYFMPEWLDAYEANGNFESAKKVYVAKFGTTDWKEKLKKMYYHDEHFALAYCLTALENNIAYNPESEALLKEVATANLDKIQ